MNVGGKKKDRRKYDYDYDPNETYQTAREPKEDLDRIRRQRDEDLKRQYDDRNNY